MADQVGVVRSSILGHLLASAPMGYSRTLPADGRGGGEGVSLPLVICQTSGPILDPKTALDSSELQLFEYVTIFYLNVTDNVTVRVKGQIFYCLLLLASPGKVTVSN